MDLKLDFWIVLGFFYLLAAWNFLSAKQRRKSLSRSRNEWILDIFGLCMHGLVVPLVQTIFIYRGLQWLVPSREASLHILPWLTFLLVFAGVDYLYYWNHRIFHTRLWRWHSMHHSSTSMDIFATSRNSLLTSFFTVYIWVNGVMLFLLADRWPYIIGIALTNGLDIFRHSSFPYWPEFLPFNFFISPREHAKHHSADEFNINFAANLNIWDKIHGTYRNVTSFPTKYGFPIHNLWKVFLRGNS